VPGGNTTDQKQAQEERDSIKQCLAICAETSKEIQTHVFEDVSAAHSAHQVIIAMLGDFIFAKQVTAERGVARRNG
jgi:hypothetical protein